jgi:hypothetical protein
MALASPLVDIAKIPTIFDLLEYMFDRYQQTLDASSYQLQC